MTVDSGLGDSVSSRMIIAAPEESYFFDPEILPKFRALLEEADATNKRVGVAVYGEHNAEVTHATLEAVLGNRYKLTGILHPMMWELTYLFVIQKIHDDGITATLGGAVARMRGRCRRTARKSKGSRKGKGSRKSKSKGSRKSKSKGSRKSKSKSKRARKSKGSRKPRRKGTRKPRRRVSRG